MEVKSSKIHGKGVFATKRLKEGDIISCDVLSCTKDTTLEDYTFPIQKGFGHCLHVGFGSFLNSSKENNLKHINIDPIKMLSYFKVIKNIEIGEEVTLDYGK